LSKKLRLDILIVKKGFVQSRQHAKALIMEGKVFVDGKVFTKAGSMVKEDVNIYIKEDIPYVSRGGLKLEAAVNFFDIRFKEKVAMDVGVSTGGFTDFMLKRGIKRVYAIDVGYGQLHWKLRNNPKIILLEKTNIRYLPREAIPEEIDIATVDVSFISLLKVIPIVKNFLKEHGELIALIKPQFEVGKTEVDKGGVIKSEEKRIKAVKKVCKAIENIGFSIFGTYQSPIKGQKGNIEYFVYAKLITYERNKKR